MKPPCNLESQDGEVTVRPAKKASPDSPSDAVGLNSFLLCIVVKVIIKL